MDLVQSQQYIATQRVLSVCGNRVVLGEVDSVTQLDYYTIASLNTYCY